MEIGKGFLELHEDYSRRSSLHPTISLGETSTSAYTTRVGCCGCCTVKVERDDGSLRIGRLSLAPYCHLALLVFGFCFLLAGAVLTWLSYSNTNLDVKHAPLISSPHMKGENSNEERVAGPLFLLVGLTLLVTGVGLAILGCKLENAAVRQRSALSRFSFESGPRSGDIFANLDDIRSQGGDSHHNRRGSFFGSSFNPSLSSTRRSTLATIAQAVPHGFFMMESQSPRTPKSPSHIPNPYKNGYNHRHSTVNPEASASTTKLSDEFQDVELGSPSRDDDEFTLPALSLRPSIIPIPMFVSPNRRMSLVEGISCPSRSDEPFGSIASMGVGKDIASFPVQRSRPSICVSMNSDQTPQINGLPPIFVEETGNALTASPKQSSNKLEATKPPLRATRSEDHDRTKDGEDSLINVVGGSIEQQKRPHSGS